MGLGKAHRIIALLLIGLAVGAGFACQIHISPPDHGHAAPGTGQAHSSAHSFLDFACIGMAAILPTLMIFASLLFQMLPATPLLLKRAAFAFPPFIPPRHTTR
jgi:hypothetical protein